MGPGVAGEQHAGVVHPDGQAAQCGSLLGDLPVGSDVSDVLLESDCTATDLGRGALSRCAVDIGQDNSVSRIGETSGKGETDAATGSGDNCCGGHARNGRAHVTHDTRVRDTKLWATVVLRS